jgi:hypothetical protein
MPAFSNADKVTITIDGVKYQVQRGVYSIRELAAFVGEQSSTLSGPPNYASLTLVSGVAAQVSPPTNGAILLFGGEVLTSTLGS